MPKKVSAPKKAKKPSTAARLATLEYQARMLFELTSPRLDALEKRLAELIETPAEPERCVPAVDNPTETESPTETSKQIKWEIATFPAVLELYEQRTHSCVVTNRVLFFLLGCVLTAAAFLVVGM